MAKLDLYFKKTAEPVSAFSLLNSPKPDTYSFNTPVLEPSTSYDFKWTMVGYKDVIETVTTPSLAIPATPRLSQAANFNAQQVSGSEYKVTWNLDPLAASYLLKRARNAAFTLEVETMYKGTSNTFTDTSTNPTYKYWYSLTKIAGPGYLNSIPVIINTANIYFNHRFTTAEGWAGLRNQFYEYSNFPAVFENGELVITPIANTQGGGGVHTTFANFDIQNGYIETEFIDGTIEGPSNQYLAFGNVPTNCAMMGFDVGGLYFVQYNGYYNRTVLIRLEDINLEEHRFWRLENRVVNGVPKWIPNVSKDGINFRELGSFDIQGDLDGTSGPVEVGTSTGPGITNPKPTRFGHLKAVKYS